MFCMQDKQGTKLNRNGWFSFVLNNVVEYFMTSFISYENTSNINSWKRKRDSSMIQKPRL